MGDFEINSGNGFSAVRTKTICWFHRHPTEGALKVRAFGDTDGFSGFMGKIAAALALEEWSAFFDPEEG